MKDSVAIVVLNWNGIKDTLKCLSSLQKQSYKNYEIILIDNNSTDNSKKILLDYEKKHNNIHIIYNSKNYGFAGGVNIGIQYSINKGFKYISLFNNDAVAEENWLKKLVESISDPKVGICTGLFLKQNSKTIDSTGEQYSKWGLPFPRDRNYKVSKATKGGLVFGATGGASLYRSELFTKIGLFDEDFFAYYEDVDISFRTQLAGWKVIYEPKAIAYHKQGATANKLSGFAVYQTFKNLPLLFIKNVPRELLFSIGIRFYFAYIMMFFKAIINGSGKQAVEGLFKSIILTSKKLKERRRIQSLKQVKTSYIKNILWPDLPPDQTGLRRLRKFFIGK